MMEPVTVVIVDDCSAVRSSLTRLAQSCGYNAKAYASAEEFLEEGRPTGDSCLLLDMRMPGMSGAELQREVLQGIPIPIVFLTGHAGVPDTVQAMQLGAVDFLEKPPSEEDLLLAIERAIRKDREERAAHIEACKVRERHASLTPREQQVFDAVVEGLSNRLIGERLGAAEKTIKVHRGRVMQKMKASSVAQLVRFAGILEAAPNLD